MRYDRDAVSPWAFFLPIALAVLVGSLVADAIGGMLRDRFEDAPPAVVAQMPAPGDTPPVETTAPVEPAPVSATVLLLTSVPRLRAMKPVVPGVPD